MNWEGLELSILGPACIAGLLVLSTHVPLGQQVLARGIIFIDLAIAQVAALGVILAQAMGVDEHGYGVEIAAAIAALAGGALLTWTDRKWPDHQEPIIGTMFVLAATGALLLLSNNPHGGEHLKDLLVGQILWVSVRQLIPVAVLSALAEQGLDWRVVFENGNIDATRAMVRLDLAVTAWLASTVPADLDILPADCGLPALPGFAICLHGPDKAAAGAVGAMADFIRQGFSPRRRAA